ncbi:unnamed protein product [Caenorhabditis brenneri]
MFSMDTNTSNAAMQQELHEARKFIQQLQEQRSADQEEIRRWKEIAQRNYNENKVLRTEIQELRMLSSVQKENLIRAHISEVRCLREIIHDKSQKVNQLRSEHKKLKEKQRRAIPALLKIEKRFVKNEGVEEPIEGMEKPEGAAEEIGISEKIDVDGDKME